MSALQNIDRAKTEVREMIKAAKYPQARIFATQLLKIHGDDAELFYLRGTACAHRSAVDQAEKDLRAAIALQPKCVDYYLTLSNILLSNGKYEQALNEFIRVKNIAPRHPKVRAYGEVLGGRQGKLQRNLEELEKRYRQGTFDRALVDSLVSLYLVNALFNWHGRYVDGNVIFHATSLQQIGEAEYYLAKAKAIRVLGEGTKQKRTRLEILVEVSRQRRFDGFAGDWLLAGAVVTIGIVFDGFLDNWYAASAIGSIWAYLRPNYMFNRAAPLYKGSIKDRFHRFIDIAYGTQIKPSMKILAGYKEAGRREFLAKLLRSCWRASIMPIAVFAGLYKNYSARHAAAFTICALALGLLLSL